MIYFEFLLVVTYWLNLRDLSLYCIYLEYFPIVTLNPHYMKKAFLLFTLILHIEYWNCIAAPCTLKSTFGKCYVS